ncbi:hypothetical protein FRC08_007911 [Ceratobasidium sp. 394]|nr:hypothetical protein FRC08_007911 [Ceratobasidium sp. 394]KAG9074956.1 hypothetical protein FS749_013447 [Ceratobasidium sp. UAMH 11750]
MVRKSAKVLTRERNLAVGREKRWGKHSPTDLSEPTAVSEPTLSLPTPPDSPVQESDHPLPEIDHLAVPSGSESANDSQDHGPDPEDLPLEDPEDEAADNDIGPEESDEWWDGASDVGQPEPQGSDEGTDESGEHRKSHVDQSGAYPPHSQPCRLPTHT